MTWSYFPQGGDLVVQSPVDHVTTNVTVPPTVTVTQSATVDTGIGQSAIVLC